MLYHCPMELRHIRYFVAAADELNLTRASLRLNVSQPAISSLIRDIESEVQAKLFTRHSHGLKLTPAGEAFLRHARLILNEYQNALNSVRHASAGPSTLNVGFILPSLSSFLGSVLSKLSEDHPDLQVQVHELSPADQFDALRIGEIDVAFFGNQREQTDNEFEMIPIKKFEFEVVLPGKHRLAQRAALDLKELAGEDFIGYAEKKFPSRNKKIAEVCMQAGFVPKFSYIASSIIEILGMISLGKGISLLPSDVANLPHPNAVFIPLNDRIEPVFITATWLPGNKNPALLCLLQHLKEGLT